MEMHEQTISNQLMEYPILAPYTPDSQRFLQDPITLRKTPSGPGMLQYPVLPQSSLKSSHEEVDMSYAWPNLDFNKSCISTEIRAPTMISPTASSIVKAALEQKGTSRAKHDLQVSRPNSTANRVHSGISHSSSHAGLSATKISIRGEDLNSEDVLTDRYATDYDLDANDLPKDTSLQYILTQRHSVEELETSPEDRHTAGSTIEEDVGQAMATSGDITDSMDSGPPPACTECYVESWLAGAQTENIDLTGANSANQPSALDHLMKAGGLALAEADPHGPGAEQNGELQRFEEDNAFIKFYLGISAETASGMNKVPKAATQLSSMPTPRRAVSTMQLQDFTRERLSGLTTLPVHPSHQAPLVFRSRQLYLDSSAVQSSSRPESHLHASPHMHPEPVLIERARPDPGHQTGYGLGSRPPTHMHGQTGLAFRPRQCIPIRDAHADTGVQPLRMSTNLLAHLPKTNTRLNARTLRHLEWAYNIWYPDPTGLMAEKKSVKLEDRTSEFDEPDWTVEEWLSIERRAMGSAHRAHGVEGERSRTQGQVGGSLAAESNLTR